MAGEILRDLLAENQWRHAGDKGPLPMPKTLANPPS